VSRARGVAIALALALAPLPGAATAQTCRLALVLGLDVSSSVDAGEYMLQIDGLAAALTAPEVRAAFLAVPGQAVALKVFEWSGRLRQVVQQDWAVIASAADLDRVAARLRTRPRSETSLPTALGSAMRYGGELLAEGPRCFRATLDISGDGMSNDGIGPTVARDSDQFAGVTINGLVVGRNGEVLRAYYRQFVIHGPGAFVEAAADFDDFEHAMRRKLVRELAADHLSGLAPPVAPEPGSRVR
jgi:hypothetical protein